MTMSERMLPRRAAIIAALCVALLASCASPPPPRPRPPPPAILPPLLNPSPTWSNWLDLPAEIDGSVGRRTGIMAIWYRCQIPKAGSLKVTLAADSDDVRFEVYDDSPVITPHSPHYLDSGGSSKSESLTLRVQPGVHYIRVVTVNIRSTINYRLGVELTPDPTQRRSGGTTRSDTHRSPAPSPRSTPQPVATAMPIPPAQPRSDAALLGGTVSATIGTGQRYSSLWYAIPVAQASTLTITMHSRSGLARFRVYIGDHLLKRSEGIASGESVTLSLSPGTYAVRTETAARETASYTLTAVITEVLTEPPSSSAIRITTHSALRVAVGKGSGVRWRWVQVPLTATSFVRIAASVLGEPVVIAWFEGGLAVAESRIVCSGELTGRFKAGAALFRVAAESGAAEVTLNLQINGKSSQPGFYPSGPKPLPQIRSVHCQTSVK